MADDTPFIRVSTDIGKAMRDKYPLPNRAVVPKFRWESAQNPREYLDKSKHVWVTHTGHHPGNAGVQKEWYRQAVLEGVPETVKNSMIDNPDMVGCDSQTWEKHLIHHLSKAQDSCHKDAEELKDLQAKLLKLQLTKVRQEVNEKKKPAKVMMADANPPALFPAPSWSSPQQHSRGGGYGGGPTRGGGGYRGRGGRGGQIRRQQGGGACYYCQGTDHWIRDCPHLPPREVGRGRGDQSQYRYQGDSQPRQQMPLLDWEGSGEQWSPYNQQ